MSGEHSAPVATVSTHVLDTGLGRPASGIAVTLAVRAAGADGTETPWTAHGTSRTDPDGRCTDLPPLPARAAWARLRFTTEHYLRARHGSAFFPEVTVDFAVAPGEHQHVPLLLSSFGYSVYRGS